MDKVIKHHFWGVVIVALALPPVAWNMTVGALNEEYETRKGALESSFNSIPKGTNAPNDDWIRGATERIDIRRTTNAQSVDRLWQTQMSLVKWPGSITGYMKDCPYRGELPLGTDPSDPKNRIYRVTPDLYKQDYISEVRKVWLIAEPLDDKDQRVDSKRPKKVHFPFAVFPKRDIAARDIPPSFKEIWNAQEDLWLLTQLMMAVRDVNASTSSIMDAYLKQIEQLELFGGKRTAPNEVAKAAATNANAVPTLPGVTAGANTSKTSVKPRSPLFELGEEYKAVGLQPSSTQPGGGLSSAAGMPSMAGGNTNANNNKKDDPDKDENRYVASEKAYRTRGFRMKVVIHQRAVPDFIAELMGSQYPIEITRFEMAALNPDDPTSNSAGLPGTGLLAGGPTPGGPIPGGPTGSDIGSGGPASPNLVGGSDDGSDIGDAFDQGTQGGGPSAAPVTDAGAQAALGEIDLVSLVVIGEMYLYNPPEKKDEGGATNTGQQPGATTPGTTPAVAPGATTPGATPATTPGATTPAAIPATTPGATTPGTTPATTPGATTPGATPAVTPGATTPGTTPAVTPGATTPGTTPAVTPGATTPGTTPATTPGVTPAPKTN